MTEVTFHQHFDFWIRVFEGLDFSWEEIFQKYNSTCDIQACLFWENLLNKFPNSKVILSVRSPESWLKNYKETVYNFATHQPLGVRLYGVFSPFMKNYSRMLDAMNKRFPVFSPVDYSDEKLLKAFKDHIEYVKKNCPSNRLLIFESKDGWDPLCKFLVKEIPKESFPNINDTNQFKNNIYGYVLFTGFITLIGSLTQYLMRKYVGIDLLKNILNSFL